MILRHRRRRSDSPKLRTELAYGYNGGTDNIVTMQMAREMEIELQQTREAIQKHAEEMISLLLELEVRLEDRLMQAQARINELKSSAASVPAEPAEADSDNEHGSPALSEPPESGGALVAMSNHNGSHSQNGSSHLSAS